MNKNSINNTLIAVLIIFTAVIILSACSMPNREQATPTLSANQAYETVQARLTEAIALTPTKTFTPEVTQTSPPTATRTPAPVTSTATVGAITPTNTTIVQSNCNQASPGNPIDVTIPDDTEILPGQTFTKTWRLINSGTCTWNSSYSTVFFSGENLSTSSSVPLSGNVTPGQSVDISVNMVAPTEPGTYQSNWKLRNASGTTFGIGPGEGSAFYVRIVVPADAPTTTPTVGATPTTQTVISGTAILFPADRLDLDIVGVNTGGADLSYVLDESDSGLYLRPQDNALFAVYGGFQPQQADCRNANLSAAQISLTDLTVGTYICYRTGSANIGWLRFGAYNQENNRIDLDANTWISQ